jgi:predicted glycogen debranching enzyme
MSQVNGIDFSGNVLRNFREGARREWLETNGIGGFACSTLYGLNTRRYHALLVAAMRPPGGRTVLLSKLEDTLVVDGRPFDLSTNQYSAAIHPHGYTHLEEFHLAPFPTSRFFVDGIDIVKSVFMVHGQNTTVIQYRIDGGAGRDVRLELRPLIAFRDYHSLTHENSALDSRVSIHGGSLASVQPYRDHPVLFFAHNATEMDSRGYWYRNFEYALERERGLDSVEDLFNPFTLRFDAAPDHSPAVIVSTNALDVDSANTLREREIHRRSRVALQTPAGDSFARSLTLAVDQYIVSRGELKTVIAGYPWFTDWGRDTMIALPGIALATGRYDIARSILLEFSRHVDCGMLPNTFPDAGERPQYNTIDATLWYFEAVRSYLEYTGDYSSVETHLYPILSDIVDWHLRGTRYGIKMDEDGLITSTDTTVQLTWMDAKVGDWVVTPRTGKVVEIQALWYNALRTMEGLSKQFGRIEDSGRYSTLADRVKASFNAVFWNESARCLYDCILGTEYDASMRPNQILAVSLTHSMLSKDRAKAVVDAVDRDLFTPYGLRTLSPADPRYRGRCEGDVIARDSAYHQGTVWPWLLGPFIDAYLKVYGSRKKAAVRVWLQVLFGHLSEAGLGHISEIFDGDPPHHPRGCFAQAWSDAELLRTITENDLGITTGKRKRATAKG